MVGPRRPQFVLFGSSIVEFSFGDQGWGAILAHIYSRKVDIFVRGYGGWNSRNAVEVLDQVFPKDDAVQPSLVIVYFGGNDAVDPRPDGLNAHVPLSEYVENMRKIAIHLKSLSEKIRIIFLSASPINEDQLLSAVNVRKLKVFQKYAEACVEMSREMGIKAINLCDAFMQYRDWRTTCFTDGIHLTPVGSNIVATEILKVLTESDWKPSLHPEALPTEFA
ncbi:GDSL esterase/lipase CPRD49-like [Rutidosis leptorrhynchoides]|uniref:GDSL esterase/lipase CPRD49-like n=1 Tax=Rutidosis leptorrhynchoides TaxID=125765 RepID=UPI003A99A38A